MPNCVCVCVCVCVCRERVCVCVCLRLVIGYTILIRLACVCEYICMCVVCVRVCVCVCVCVCRERESLCVCLRLIVGYTVLIGLACVCVYSMYILSMCVCACASSSGTRCSYVLPVPRLVLPRLAYHVGHQDKRIRRGVEVRAGGSPGRSELQAAADNELVTERCAIRRN